MKPFAKSPSAMRRTGRPATPRSTTIQFLQHQQLFNVTGLRLCVLGRAAVDDDSERLPSSEGGKTAPSTSGTSGSTAPPETSTAAPVPERSASPPPPQKYKLTPPVKKHVVVLSGKTSRPSQDRRMGARLLALEARGSMDPELLDAMVGPTAISGGVGSLTAQPRSGRGSGIFGVSKMSIEDLFYLAVGVFIVVAVARPDSVGSRFIAAFTAFLMLPLA
ncbi:hypothetical protein PLESTB_001814600 [Pleodorina starrii]|uniref:Uncharacterized protein n=1 Tax=Pleodorina starrii TaxID=330485 RepID=A0A9W6C097_9CHLO|nr:hypothetical protein PLESTM_001400600 [Pleodorina starrii]GLC61886.1 hypothetical protein PLESTB_001814600 [Pleodorina starrii]GLC75914.1 hypothetical protein PLESTF_001705500 [Pleodorina starrii]